MSDIPFYYVERPQGSNNYFVFSSVREVSPRTYVGSKGLMDKICSSLNHLHNAAYKKLEVKPMLTVKGLVPLSIRELINEI